VTGRLTPGTRSPPGGVGRARQTRRVLAEHSRIHGAVKSVRGWVGDRERTGRVDGEAFVVAFVATVAMGVVGLELLVPVPV
jgi:hypothetical protein